jgi:hypothetical protein
VKELLQDTIMRYSPASEQEFIAIALALYLPPTASTWKNQYNNAYNFDDAANALLGIDHGRGSFGGCHVPYAMTVILRVDDLSPILSPQTRKKMLRWIRDLSRKLEESQRPSGGWDFSWPRTSTVGVMYGDPCLDRITITGHHLEWIAMAPDSVRPALPVITRAVAALLRDISDLPDLGGPRLFKSLLPCSHAARSLCLMRGVSAYDTWNSFASRGELERSPKGYRMKVY